MADPSVTTATNVGNNVDYRPGNERYQFDRHQKPAENRKESKQDAADSSTDLQAKSGDLETGLGLNVNREV